MLDLSRTVLVTGASGFIGQNLLDALKSENRGVVSVGGSSNSCDISCDFSRDFDLSSVLSGTDCVIHLAAKAHIPAAEADKEYLKRVNVDAPISLAKQAAAAGVRRFVFLSSIGVCGGASVEPFKIGMPDAPHDAYSESKKAAEDGLRAVATQTALELVIVRPPMVYGAGAPGNFPKLKKLATLGLPLPFGGIGNKRSFISVVNLTNFLVACIDELSAAGEVFLVADSERISTVEFMRQIASSEGVKCRFFFVPPAMVSTVFSLFGKRSLYEKVFGNLEVDTSYAQKVLGWRPPVTMIEGLRRAARR